MNFTFNAPQACAEVHRPELHALCRCYGPGRPGRPGSFSGLSWRSPLRVVDRCPALVCFCLRVQRLVADFVGPRRRQSAASGASGGPRRVRAPRPTEPRSAAAARLAIPVTLLCNNVVYIHQDIMLPCTVLTHMFFASLRKLAER